MKNMFLVRQLGKQKIPRKEIKINYNSNIVNILVNILLFLFFSFIQ